MNDRITRPLVPGAHGKRSKSYGAALKARSIGTEDIDATIQRAIAADDLDEVLETVPRKTRRTIQERLRKRGWGTSKQQGRS